MSPDIVVALGLVAIWTPMLLLARGRIPATVRVRRAALTASVAASSGLLAWLVWSMPQPQRSDVAQVWAGARALLAHRNPYDAVGPGRTFEWPYPLLYPMTAVLTLAPIAPLPLRWIDPLFVAAGFGLYAWAVTRSNLRAPALIALVSLPALMTLQTSQWSLLVTGAALVPALGFLLVAKPTIGLALFAANPKRTTAIGCAVFLIISLVIWPGWIRDWRATFASAPHIVAPILRPGGVLVLLALARWRRAEARLLVAMACVPHTTAPYETIPLFLVPETWREAIALSVLAILAYVGQYATGPYASQNDYWESGAKWIVLLMYLPSVAMVLSRKNVSSELPVLIDVSPDVGIEWPSDPPGLPDLSGARAEEDAAAGGERERQRGAEEEHHPHADHLGEHT